MAAVAGLAAGVEDAFAVFARKRQRRHLGAMDDDEVDPRQRARVQPFLVGQRFDQHRRWRQVGSTRRMLASLHEGHCILSHGFESGPDATKVTALAEAAERLGWSHERPDYTDLDARREAGELGDVPARLERLLGLARDAASRGPLVLAGSSLGAWISGRVSLQVPARALFLMAPPAAMAGAPPLDAARADLGRARLARRADPGRRCRRLGARTRCAAAAGRRFAPAVGSRRGQRRGVRAIAGKSLGFARHSREGGNRSSYFSSQEQERCPR